MTLQEREPGGQDAREEKAEAGGRERQGGQAEEEEDVAR
jgi:hypothetical protein